MIQEIFKTTNLGSINKVTIPNNNKVYFIAQKEVSTNKKNIIRSEDVLKITYELLIDSNKSSKIVVDNFTINFNGSVAYFADNDTLTDFYIKPSAIVLRDGTRLKEGQVAISLVANIQ